MPSTQPALCTPTHSPSKALLTVPSEVQAWLTLARCLGVALPPLLHS